MTPQQRKTLAAQFIAVFEEIPDEMWCKGTFIDSDGSCCAAGHLGARNLVFCTPSVEELDELLHGVVAINDAPGHPKENIINALIDVLEGKR